MPYDSGSGSFPKGLQPDHSGYTDSEITVELIISSKTVSVHVRAIRRALGARSRSQAVALAIQQGLLPAATGDPPETPS